jgi:hypothetical protein
MQQYYFFYNRLNHVMKRYDPTICIYRPEEPSSASILTNPIRELVPNFIKECGDKKPKITIYPNPQPIVESRECKPATPQQQATFSRVAKLRGLEVNWLNP